MAEEVCRFLTATLQRDAMPGDLASGVTEIVERLGWRPLAESASPAPPTNAFALVGGESEYRREALVAEMAKAIEESSIIDAREEAEAPRRVPNLHSHARRVEVRSPRMRGRERLRAGDLVTDHEAAAREIVKKVCAYICLRKVASNCDCRNCSAVVAISTALDAAHRAGAEEMRASAANAIPTSWLDPLLSGPTGLGMPPWGCPDVEKLLRGIAEALRTLEVPK